MENFVGTMSIGVRAPIIRKGDRLAEIVAQSVFAASKQLKLPIENKDVIAVTESVVARAEGNYVSVDDVADDIRERFGDSKIAVVHPILSRNRFGMILKGICRGAKGGIIMVLSLPADEVGNHLISDFDYLYSGFSEKVVVTEKEFRKKYPRLRHEFTGMDYIEYYRSIAKAEKCNIEFIFTNDIREVVKYTKYILTCDIHARALSKRILSDAGANKVFGLDDICSLATLKTGFNIKFGLLGSNMANEETLKLLPRNPSYIVDEVQNIIYEWTKKEVEVLVYGDGAFKDPVGQIWELADPVVGVAFSMGLRGRPNELKLKALADNKYSGLSGEELQKAIKKEIEAKEAYLVGKMSSEGTTPRQYSDLIGSLADLTSGSGDKGTPIVWVKGYFRNYAD